MINELRLGLGIESYKAKRRCPKTITNTIVFRTCFSFISWGKALDVSSSRH